MTARIVQTISETTPEAVCERLTALHPGIDLVEIRFDALGAAFDVARLVAAAPVDVLATVRRADQGGSFGGTEAERIGLLRQAAAAGAALVDLEEDVPWQRDGSGPRIIRSLHDFDKVPADIETRARTLARDADIVKVACMPRDPSDACRLVKLPALIEKPTVAIGMGATGRWGRIVAGAFGMPLTYAATPDAGAAAPGQVAADRMVEVYRADRIDPSWRIGLVAADPGDESGWVETIDRALGEATQPAVVTTVPAAPFAALRCFLDLESITWLLLDRIDPAGAPDPSLLAHACRHAATRGPLAEAAGLADLLVRGETGWHGLALWGSALRKILAPRFARGASRPGHASLDRANLWGDAVRVRMAAAALESLGITSTQIDEHPDPAPASEDILEICLEEDPVAPADLTASRPGERARPDFDSGASHRITAREIAHARLEILWDHLSSTAPPDDLTVD